MFQFEFNPNDPACIKRALKTEWLLTNGLGGYAMGTILGVNTRRYHGLLVAATKPPVGRIVALHSMIEQLVIPNDDAPGGEEVIDLSTQQFVGPPPDGEPILHPNGWRLISQFNTDDADPHALQWHWSVGSIHITRQLTILQGDNGVALNYQINSAHRECILRLRPFVSLRDFHSVDHEFGDGLSVEEESRTITVAHGKTKLTITYSAGFAWSPERQWWNRFAYVRDGERGQEWQEDVWSPGVLNLVNAERQPLGAGLLARLYDATRDQEFMSCTVLMNSGRGREPIVRLRQAADKFIVKRMTRTAISISVIAGYPWFGDWGRDTMISLPGLMLCTKHFDEARSCLMMFATNLKNGLIPNVFDDYGGAAHYNTVDAPLWFIHAVHEYWKATHQAPSPSGRGQGEGDRAAGTQMKSGDRSTNALTPSPSPAPGGRGGIDPTLLSACRDIIAAYRRGTDFNIFMDADGLISAGDEGSQLTWMDAKRDGVCFTPRHGKPVEINALWHNALLCMAEMTGDLKEREELAALSRQVAGSFREVFWWDDKQCLHDVLLSVRSDEASVGRRFVSDGHLRPNQIFAVSLAFSPLNETQQRAVVKIVGDRLLTPYGLRTLDHEVPNYRGRYEGSLFERDRAYHNGTVWPWLIGPYCEALLRVEKFSDAAKQKVRELLQPLLNELDVPSGGGCVNQLAEVYDGDEPQRPGGCPAQAWSVAEVLRILTLIDAV